MSHASDRVTHNDTKDKDFNKISADHIPFASYVNPETIITKNGDIMQTICITCHDHNANINGILGENIRNAIRNAIKEQESEYAFWVHSIKIDSDLASNLQQYDQENLLYYFINNDWFKYQKTFDNYATLCFLTIVKKGINLSLNPSNILLFLNKTMFYKVHDIWVKRNASTLGSAVNKIMKQLSQYSIKKLSIVKNNDTYNAEQLSFFSYLINFSHADHIVPMADLSTTLNKSKYIFENGILIAKNNGQRVYSIFLKLKDTNNLPPALVSEMISRLKDTIAFEYFHFEPKNRAKQEYNSYITQLQKKTLSESVLDVLGLDFLPNINKNKDIIFCKQYSGVILTSKSMDDLQLQIKNFSDACIEYGMVFGFEDVSVERAFYSMLPGNFQYFGHCSVVPFYNTFNFIKSHKMDNENVTSYFNKKGSFVLPTLKKYPYIFGILEKKTDILISSSRRNQAKNNFTKVLLSLLSNNFSKTYIIDNTDTFKTFVELANGDYYHISRSITQNESIFDLFNIQNVGKISRQEILLNVITMMTMSLGCKLTPSQVDKIIASINKIKTIQDIIKIEPTLSKYLSTWSFDGKLGFVFNAKTEKSHTEQAITCFDLDRKIMNNRHMRALIIYYALLKIISTTDGSKNTLVLISDPLVFMDHSIFKANLDTILSEARKKNITFIFSVEDSEESLVSEKTGIQISQLLQNCDTQFHFGGTNMTEAYSEQYQLSNAESYAIQNIKDKLNQAILRQNGIILPVLCSINSLHEYIINIIEDGADIRHLVDLMQKKYNTNNKSDILKALLTGNNKYKEEIQTDNKTKYDQETAVKILNAA